MFRHAKRDVHNFSEIRQQLRTVQRSSMAAPVRRSARVHHQTPPKVRNTALAHPEDNCDIEVEVPSQASGPRENHGSSCMPPSESSGMRSDGPRKRPPMRLLGSPRPEEADASNRPLLDPVDAKSNYTPFLDDLSVYYQYLWERIKNSSDEFEEFKRHIRRMNAFVFNWLVMNYRLFRSVSWYITVCTSSFSSWATFSRLRDLCFAIFRRQGCGSMDPPSKDNVVCVQAQRCSADSLDVVYDLTYCARTHLNTHIAE
ncbi:hypothetical protein BC827DRAFT_970992 [Russula dissimulans]|nr:hypothetical protein BC827DRAFT_970992 [Russula dissimulans]